MTHAPLFFGSLCVSKELHSPSPSGHGGSVTVGVLCSEQYWRDSLPHSWSGDLSAVVGPMKDKMAVVLELVSGSAV